MQPITITSRRCVRRTARQFPNFLEGMPVPDLQHDHFALFRRQRLQASHGLPFTRRFGRSSVEPMVGFQLPQHATKERTFEVQRPVANGPHRVMGGAFGFFRQLQQRRKDFLNNIFRFTVGQTKSPGIEQQIGRLFLVQSAAPTMMFWEILHAFSLWTLPAAVLYGERRLFLILLETQPRVRCFPTHLVLA